MTSRRSRPSRASSGRSRPRPQWRPLRISPCPPRRRSAALRLPRPSLLRPRRCRSTRPRLPTSRRSPPSSAPVAGRPWLEFLLRPVRAGTSQDDAIVQFELTVGNTGTVAAKDVKISTWMFAAGEGTDMERMLIEPPADATVSEVDIGAGDGTRVDAEIALPKAGLHEQTVLPVVVADARYRLPDGSEGRTSASFAVGLPGGEGEELSPFQLDRATGLIESVEARLHGEPTRV